MDISRTPAACFWEALVLGGRISGKSSFGRKIASVRICFGRKFETNDDFHMSQESIAEGCGHLQDTLGVFLGGPDGRRRIFWDFNFQPEKSPSGWNFADFSEK